MDIVTGRGGLGPVRLRSEFYRVYQRYKRGEPAWSQPSGATWVSMHGACYTINDEQMDACRRALAKDLVTGAKIPGAGGTMSDPAICELKRLPHKIAPALFDFDPVLVERKLSIDDMVCVARESVLPTLRAAFDASTLPPPGSTALIVMMAARRNCNGEIIEVYKETVYVKCGRCGAEKHVPCEHSGYIMTCDNCGSSYDVDTCTALDHDSAPARRIVHYKSGAHFQVPCDVGPFVDSKDAELLTSYADALLQRSAIVPIDQAEFDKSVCHGSGLRCAYCPKVKVCEWCEGASAKRRQRANKPSRSCSMCAGLGKRTDWRCYWPVACLDINGKRCDEELARLQDGEDGIYRTLTRTSVRPPATVTSTTPGFKRDDLESARPPRTSTDLPEDLQDALLFQHAMPGEDKVLEQASLAINRKRKRTQTAASKRQPNTTSITASIAPASVSFDPRGTVAKLAHAEIAAYSNVYAKSVIEKFVRLDKGMACAWLTSFNATMCSNAKKKTGHRSSRVFFMFKYTTARGAELQQRCLSKSLGPSGEPCFKYCKKHNEWRRVVNGELTRLLFSAASAQQCNAAIGAKASNELWNDMWRTGLPVLYDNVGDMDWIREGF